MVSVGDAAVKIDATASRVTGGQPTGFRAEARKVLSPRALFDARAALGDPEMAARARTMTVAPARSPAALGRSRWA